MPVSERELVASIVAAPDDDGPREVYADWLLGRGDPRGELIIAQCALARAEARDAPAPERLPLRRRVRALTAAHADTWLDPLFAITPGRYELRRGLPEHVDLETDVINAEKLRDVAPMLRSLAATSPSSQYSLVEATQVLPVEELRFAGAYRATLNVLASGPHAHRLRRLELHRLTLSPSEVTEALVPGVEHLGIEPFAQDFYVGWLRALARRQLPLRSLSLRGETQLDLAPLVAIEPVRVDVVGVALGTLPTLPILESISISATALELAPERLLDRLPRLHQLRLIGCGVDDQFVIKLARDPRASRLRRLNLASNAITPRAVSALEALHDLVQLHVKGNRLDMAARKRLAAALPRAQIT